MLRLTRCTLISTLFMGCTCGSSSDVADGLIPTADLDASNDSSAAGGCTSDADCATGFCDVGTCAVATPVEQTGGLDYWYGRPCFASTYIGPYGTRFGGLIECQPQYNCVEGRCRSCESSQQCYELMGLLSCSASEGRPGKQCRNTSADGSELYVPLEPPPRDGRRLDAVPQPAGAAESVSFTLGPGVPPTSARLAVVWWHQRNGDFDEYRQIAYDVAIDPSTAEVEIPFSELALPFAENLICFRDCTDRALCGCRSPEVAVASVMVALDLDADGALSLSELRAEQVGGAVVLIGWAPEAQNGFPRGFQGLFDVILAGFSAYTEIPLVPATTDVAYPIEFCPAGDSTCQFPLTRLLCHRDCERDWGLNRFGI